jgi:hypothetical protein
VEQEAYLDAVEAGRLYRVDPETIKRQFRQGLIPGYRIGRVLRFDPAELREHFRSAPGEKSSARATATPDFDALERDE